MLAIALSGGGAKGSFQVGALRYLWNIGVRPQIVTGTSVGAINSLKLAEGSRDPVLGIETIWFGLEQDTDMYVRQRWFNRVLTRAPALKGTLNEIFDPAALVAGAIFFPLGIINLFRAACAADEINDLLNEAQRARSMFSLAPTRALVERNIREAAIRDSGILLRLAVVSLETGELRYVTERGRFDGATRGSISLIDATMASAAIPGVFEDVVLEGNHYVDGGVREVLPLAKALDLGATHCWAIVTSPAAVQPKPSSAINNIVAIADRSVLDLVVSEILLNETHPRMPWPDGVRVIQPTISVHSSMQIDPGLIRINVAYGFMRANDVQMGFKPPRDWLLTYTPPPDALTISRRFSTLDRSNSGVLSAERSDQITLLRLAALSQERKFIRAVVLDGAPCPTGGQSFGEGTLCASVPPRTPTRMEIGTLRGLKRFIHDFAQKRKLTGGVFPDGFSDWWRSWERQPGNPPMITPTPWDRVTVRGRVIAPAEVPPPDI